MKERVPVKERITNGLEISIVDREEGLEHLQKDWNHLLQQSSSDTIFLTWEWVVAWWRSYGAGKKLWVLKIEKEGILVGLVPLYCKRFNRFGIFQYRGLYWIGDGSGDSDYLDVIIKVGEEEVVIQAVVEFLLRHRDQWDLLFLNEVPETSPNLKLFQKLFQREGLYWEETDNPCTYAPLPSDWNDYLKKLKPRMRTKIRSLPKQLEQKLKVRFDCCQQPDNLRLRLESLFNLHEQRWSLKNQEGVFVSPAKRQFYQEISSVFLSRGWLRFYSLAIDEQYIAHQFCFEYRTVMFLLQEGFDPKWTDYGVGNVLRAYVFRDCIERKVSVYDFLAGVTSHKLSWGGSIKKSIRAAVGLPIVKNKVFFALPKFIASGKRRLKKVIPESMLVWSLKKRRLLPKEVPSTDDIEKD